MKKYFFFIFLIAFAACATWSIWTDTSKPAHTDFSSSAPKQSFWMEPLAPLKEKAYPSLHFHEAMENHIKSIPMYVSIHLIPKDMRHAIIATEDRRFYEHGALDPIGILRAITVNIYSGSTLEGGSTISQQVVKNVFLSHERTFTRKAQEVVLAYLLEHYYTKDEILEIYLNTAYFGANATGIYEASEIYYDINPEKLRLSQTSMLAGLVQAPTYYNPLQNYEAARERQKIVLALMVEQGYISNTTAAEAYQEHTGLKIHP